MTRIRTDYFTLRLPVSAVNLQPLLVPRQPETPGRYPHQPETPDWCPHQPETPGRCPHQPKPLVGVTTNRKPLVGVTTNRNQGRKRITELLPYSATTTKRQAPTIRRFFNAPVFMGLYLQNFRTMADVHKHFRVKHYKTNSLSYIFFTLPLSLFFQRTSILTRENR